MCKYHDSYECGNGKLSWQCVPLFCKIIMAISCVNMFSCMNVGRADLVVDFSVSLEVNIGLLICILVTSMNEDMVQIWVVIVP